jgi:hypothetical protein
VVSKFRERLSVSKQAAQNFGVEIFSLKNLSEMEVRKEYLFIIPRSYAALENLNNS